MPNSGVYTVGDKVIGYTERKVVFKSDISPDLRTERKIVLEQPYIVKLTWRYITYNHIAHYLSVRHLLIQRPEKPYFSERKIFLKWKLSFQSTRKIVVQTDIWTRKCFVESLYTNTPLLLKYPKYYNWEYVPQVLNLEFHIWSFYKLEENDITLYIVSKNNPNRKPIILNSGKDKSKFKIEIIKTYPNNKGFLYKIQIFPDVIFNIGEELEISLVCYDVKGNYLKQGLW